ncbi:IS110 family transposase [Sphingomonas crusticola]|uniref:IS110 family transposase n=1 Tax=Sphingomonas crusticola TaxID=1697973 RepID=UPI0013C2F3B8|nr:IS110 family transposase [Sphingomonas crusticola]
MDRKRVWVGLDTGADVSRICAIDDDMQTLIEETVPSDARAVKTALMPLARGRIRQIAVEAGSTSTRLTHDLRAAGFPVVIYEARQVSRFLRIRNNKTDGNDARGLAEIGKLLPNISQVHLKSPEVQRIRSQLLFRHKLTLQRVACEGMMRSLLRLHGGRLASSKSVGKFEANVTAELDRLMEDAGIDLSQSVLPLLELSVGMRRFLQSIEKELADWAANEPVCSRFQTIPGVGPICAVSFFTAIEDPHRFKRASDVGPYLGLTPVVLQSGHSLRHGRISKRGNKITRAHLNLAASVMLGARMADHSLKTWGLAIAERAGRGKARSAVARRLAVTMLAMWKNGSSFDKTLAAARQSTIKGRPSTGASGF